MVNSSDHIIGIRTGSLLQCMPRFYNSNIILVTIKDFGPLDITPPRCTWLEGVPKGNHPCEKSVINDIKNGYCVFKSSSMRIFSAHCISHDVHRSSTIGTCVRRAYPGLKCECERVSRDQCQKTSITIQISVQLKKWGTDTVPCKWSNIRSSAPTGGGSGCAQEVVWAGWLSACRGVEWSRRSI
jgi:hypothetical protein